MGSVSALIAAPTTLPKVSPALVQDASASLENWIGSSSLVNHSQTPLIALPILLKIGASGANTALNDCVIG
ncbi:hypothetical protein [Escherichia coli]|uniref:hypothetical protein n=1 Tax=Escherichia coli TaxID=562 RepID=UPI002022860A|nr:hypothetical protein [Escherichia coli]